MKLRKNLNKLNLNKKINNRLIVMPSDNELFLGINNVAKILIAQIIKYIFSL